MNEYYEVREATEAKVETGPVMGAGWAGAAQVLQRATESIALEPGDQIHVLAGGTFAVLAGSRVVRLVSGDAWSPRLSERQLRAILIHAAPITKAAAHPVSLYR